MKITTKYIMVTTMHNEISQQRLEESLYCIQMNLENNLFEKIIIFLESHMAIDAVSDENLRPEIIELLKNDRIQIKLINYRPTYEEFFKFCNEYEKDRIFFLVNSDIYFPKWNQSKLRLLSNVNFDKNIIVLTRFNIFDQLDPRYKATAEGVFHEHDNVMYQTQRLDGASIDSWIFKTPFDTDKADFKIELGRFRCDGFMTYQLSKIRKVYNPCLSIFTVHAHNNWGPYSLNDTVKNFQGKNWLLSDYLSYMDQAGHKDQNASFCRFEFIEN